MTMIDEAMKMITPAGAEQTFRSMQPKPIGAMIMYVAILGVLTFIGTLVGMMIWGVGLGFGLPVTWALVSAIIGWLGIVIAIVGSGFLFSAISQSIVKRQVSTEEAVTMVGYAATPALLAGILNIVPYVGGILVFLALLYSAFLFYIGAKVRFGADSAVAATIVVVIAWIVISLIFGFIAGAILWGAVWSSAAYSIPRIMYY